MCRKITKISSSFLKLFKITRIPFLRHGLQAAKQQSQQTSHESYKNRQPQQQSEQLTSKQPTIHTATNHRQPTRTQTLASCSLKQITGVIRYPLLKNEFTFNVPLNTKIYHFGGILPSQSVNRAPQNQKCTSKPNKL